MKVHQGLQAAHNRLGAHGSLSPGEPVWSLDRTKILFSGNQTAQGSDEAVNDDIYVIDPDGGNPDRLADWEGTDAEGNWSPDGRPIVFVSDRSDLLRIEASNLDIYVMDDDGSNVIRMTDHPEHDIDPAWSPDGPRIVFISMRTGMSGLYVMNADGTSVTLLLEDTTGQLYRPAWSPDGTTIRYRQDPCCNLWLMNPDGTDRRNITDLAQVTNHPSFDSFPDW